MKNFRLSFAVAAIALASAAGAETLTNRSVIALQASGLDADTIVAKIQSSDAAFDLSTSQLVALKKQGVPSSVISAMLATQSKSAGERSNASSSRFTPPTRGGEMSAVPASRPAGVYLQSGSQLVRIEPNVSGQTKTGGFLGSALTYGIAKVSVKVVLQGETARIKTAEKSPTFYFYLPGAARAAASSFEQQGTDPTSPNDFSLLRLEMKQGSREARVGRGNITGYQAGVVSKDRIDYTFDEVRPGVFAVHITNPLVSGEYSFVMIGSGTASVSKFFDFSVQ